MGRVFAILAFTGNLQYLFDLRLQYRLGEETGKISLGNFTKICERTDSFIPARRKFS